MVIVKPGDVVTQNFQDVVIYQLPFADWSTDLDKADNKNAKVSFNVLRGAPLSVKSLPYRVGSQIHEIRVSGGGPKKGEYEIIRTVKSDTETRVRRFTVKTE